MEIIDKDSPVLVVCSSDEEVALFKQLSINKVGFEYAPEGFNGDAVFEIPVGEFPSRTDVDEYIGLAKKELN